MSYLSLLGKYSPPNSEDTRKTETPQQEGTESTITEGTRLLNLAGVRIIREGNGLRIGLWEDVDAPEIRAALSVLGMGALRIIYLESADVPLRFKVRSCPDREPGESFTHWLRRAEQAQARLLAAYEGIA